MREAGGVRQEQREDSGVRNVKISEVAKLGIAGFAALGLTAKETEAKPKCDLLKVAQERIAQQYPRSDTTGFKQVIRESGNLWELTYELPRGMLGGAPIITIDKRTCKVVRAVHEQ